MRIDRREALILIAAGVAGSVLVFPYVLATTALPPEIPLGVLVGAQFAQSAILVSIAVIAGLWCARRVGLGAPVIEAWLRGDPVRSALVALLPLAVAVGLACGMLIVALDATVFRDAIPDGKGIGAAPAWTGFLASFYGGITEEILTRLFLVSLGAWALSRLLKLEVAIGIAILASALLFGLGHLPATAQLVPLSPLVVTRAIVLNGIPGVAFGWLYWRRGLEAAMLAHFTADLVLHVGVAAAT